MVRFPAPFFVTPPAPLPMPPEIAVSPVPATVRLFDPLVTAPTVSAPPPSLVHVCAAPMMIGALNVCAPEPDCTVMPPEPTVSEFDPPIVTGDVAAVPV